MGLLLILSTCAAPASAQWINEVHYDNDGADVGEGVEVVLPASANPARFALYFYNGNDGATYAPSQNVGTDFTEGETVGDFTLYSLAFDPIQNGAPDGLALAENGILVPGQFLSYEGVFTAVGGPADDVMSTDIGVAEGSTTPVGFSLQLTGTGASYEDFAWQLPATDSFGRVNDGQVFPPPAMTQIQVIHNSPDPAFTEVDVYVNGDLFENDLAFRTGTPFFDVPAGTALDIAVAPGDSESAADAIVSRTLTFEGLIAYHLVLMGVDGGNFEPNPDGRDIFFTFRAYPGARTASQTEGVVELNFLPLTPDASRLDIRTDGGIILYNNVLYGIDKPYRPLAVEPLELEVTSADFSESYGRFAVDLSGRENQAGMLLTSGFLTPENEDDTNGEPPSLGLLLVFADGSEMFAEPFPVANEAGVVVLPTLGLGGPYPNPARGQTARVTVPLLLGRASAVRVALYDVLGREVAVLHDGLLAPGEHPLLLQSATLPSGVYLIRATTLGGDYTSERLTLLR